MGGGGGVGPVSASCSQPGRKEEEEGPVCRDLQWGSGEGMRAAAEHCSLRQAGTQWPNYHTGWQAGRQAGVGGWGGGVRVRASNPAETKKNKSQIKGHIKMATLPAGVRQRGCKRSKVCNGTVIFTLDGGRRRCCGRGLPTAPTVLLLLIVLSLLFLLSLYFPSLCYRV